MALWGQDTVKDVAESVGIINLNKDVNQALCRDVEYRISQILEEAMKFMRHAKRTTLWSQDVSQALHALDIEPLYGYDTTRPLRFGEASIGPGQPLFYVEDEEMDFEKLVNAPLPKVPREISFTAHWLAVEGVQPSIPQNPTASDSRNLELLPKGPNANPALAAMNNAENTTTKPQVKHILSKELQLYFEKVCSSILDETQEEYRTAGLASLEQDPGLQQLVPYFIQFVSEKVTHNLKDLFVLTQMMNLTDALARNPKLNLAPYISSLIPPLLTCLIGRSLGPLPISISTFDNDLPTSTQPATSYGHFPLRTLSAALLSSLCTSYGKYSHALKPRLARSLLRAFLDPKKPSGTHYGAVLGLRAIGGSEVVRALIVPTLKEFEEVLVDDLRGENGEGKRGEAEMVVGALLDVLASLKEDKLVLRKDVTMVNGHAEEVAEDVRKKLIEKVGPIMGGRIADAGDVTLAKAVLDS